MFYIHNSHTKDTFGRYVVRFSAADSTCQTSRRFQLLFGQSAVMAHQKAECEFNLKLVEAVENFPCLYNYKLAEYARKDITEKAWTEVAKEVNDTVSKCKQKWQNVRTAFVRNLKSPPSGSGAKSKKPYYLAEHMQFVLPFVKPNTPDSDTQGNIPSTSEQHSEDESESIDESTAIADNTDEADATQASQGIGNDGTQTINRKKSANTVTNKRKPELSDADRAFVEFCDIRKKKTTDADPNQMFLLSLLPEMENQHSVTNIF
ncbi:uncharacterized protein LOC116171864 isoform X2 [Photinus pyralis]|uniref:uncharacterized protein LOC116159116 isoform X2 n=1 Tax=Photinus pyralis TaxID=7054 RepID=UPI0012676B40|nr:uncharacterized protein LOC116159116 isoform X2 [Photinus pyralis]XP_031327951.1 uncharacterized protein LOC116159157 isoform X2 [Photinus pyralis]XP_031344670.1 uncharacterized protein LOC116171807 isoform X2 [Photinus pyralis]XP_031344751.1 uncharacterized protein LOC116171864 isoform X2 [Photinus pyralis]